MRSCLSGITAGPARHTSRASVVTVSGTYASPDEPRPEVVMRATLSADRARSLRWGHLQADQLASVLDEWWGHPGLTTPRPNRCSGSRYQAKPGRGVRPWRSPRARCNRPQLIVLVQRVERGHVLDPASEPALRARTARSRSRRKRSNSPSCAAADPGHSPPESGQARAHSSQAPSTPEPTSPPWLQCVSSQDSVRDSAAP